MLAPKLAGRVVLNLRTGPKSAFFLTPPDVLKRKLEGQQLGELSRAGKYLLLGLSSGDRLLFHLGMTGQLFMQGASSPRLLSSTAKASLSPEDQRQGFKQDKHTHFSLEFTDGGPSLHFRDVRKFGKVQWLARDSSCARLEKLGKDALLATGPELYAKARLRRAPIKSLLLDQSVFAGVGNIYADEALFLASIRPTRAANRVSRARCDALVAALQQVMLRSIETGGSSISDYINPDGKDGGYQDERQVYARTGEPCLSCRGPIRRIVVGQRGTHFCPKCQR